MLRSEKRIPIILGPRIPSKNDIEKSDLYCQIILLLFKPWINILELKNKDESWKTGLQKFITLLSFNKNNRLLTYIDNLELLHKSEVDAQEQYRKQKINKDNPTNDKIDENASDDLEDDDEYFNIIPLDTRNEIKKTEYTHTAIKMLLDSASLY